MRGDSLEKTVRRSASELLHRDTLKVVNMVDLARELSGAPETHATVEPPTSPAEFWKRRFAGWRSATPLCVTVPPQNVTARRPGLFTTSFPETLSDRLRAFADQVGVPFGVLFQSAWALLLHRYSGEDDIVFGTVKGCIERDSADGEPAVHIVPARIVLETQARVRPWLRALAEQARETAPFEFIPFDHIRQAAGIAPETPMFESVLSVGHDTFDPLAIATVQPHADQTQAGGDTYPLVGAVYFGRELTLRVAYSPNRFSDTAIKLLAGHFTTLLNSMCDAPDELLTAVGMLTAPERAQVLCGFNATETPWPAKLCVHQLFEQQVERTPDAPAVTFQGESLSYRELNYRANALANELRARGLRADSIVAVCLERSFDMVVSVLAALKAGAAYLPLDPTYPHERLQFMLEDSHAAVLLTQTKLRGVFPNTPVSMLFLDAEWNTGGRVNRENPANVTAPENLSYLIYTSGSTGKPKGVAMIHRALVNLIDWQLKQSPLGAGDKTLQFTSLSFDVSFQEMFSTWCSGGTLVLIPAELRLSPRDLWNFIAQENIARIFLPFVALQHLAEAAAAEGTTAGALREVITAGEQLQVTPRLRELFQRHPEATLHNHYGPSETHVVTALELKGNPEKWPALPSIGRPIQNTQVYLLDKHFVPVPVGIPGELYIGGVALARGYFERPDVTAEKFITDPFNSEPGARLYKAGDLARFLPNGEIEFLGRIDHQVKIRGYRVELGEIETSLARQNGVRECAVTAREAAPGNKQLVAYVVAHKPGDTNAATLRGALKQQLPEYMVPSAFVFLEKLPLTPSGKVDRKSLPAPDQAPAPAAPTAPADNPWLPIQFQLVQIWEEVLGVRPVGIRDNFFELGGHSLLAVKMMDRVEHVVGKKLPVTALFEDPTITHLAELILAEDQHAPAPVLEVQTQGVRPPVYFLHGDLIGGGFYARDLSRLLGNDQPFYVLPPKDIVAGALPCVEDIAAQHLRDLRAHRPRGPYLLGGFCIGALVAYEMAVRLRASGEDVPFVAMIDPQLPSSLLRANYELVDRWSRRRGWSVPQKLSHFARGHKVLFRCRELWNAPLGEKARFAFERTGRVMGRSSQNGDSEFATPSPDGNGHANGSAEQDILVKFLWILSAYDPPTHDGAVTFFLTDEQKASTPFLARKWRKFAPNMEVHRIPGRHLSAITTDVHVLAGKMRQCLDQAIEQPCGHT